METKTITVHVESEPHNENLDSVILNAPAPQGGAFLIDQRLPREIWNQLKAAGAWYYSQDDLEEFDMFQSEPGWRYNLAALKVTLANGYALNVRGETVTTVEQLDALFTPEAIADYWTRRKAEKEAAAEAKRAEDERKRQEHERAVAEYQAWKQTTLGDLVKTFASPDRELGWERVAHFDAGGWYTTGDTWYRAEYDGETVYRCAYGNAIKYFSSQRAVDAWIEAEWQSDVQEYGAARAARNVLYMHAKYPNNEVVFSDKSNHLVELRGEEFFAELARGEVWYRNPYNGGASDVQDVAARYGLTVVSLQSVPREREVGTDYNTLKGIVDTNPAHVKHNTAKTLWQDAEGTLYGESYNGEFWKLTDEQIAVVSKK